MVEKHFNISIAPVRSRGGSLVCNKETQNKNSVIIISSGGNFLKDSAMNNIVFPFCKVVVVTKIL
jgi:hypothetical protein